MEMMCVSAMSSDKISISEARQIVADININKVSISCLENDTAKAIYVYQQSKAK